MTDCDPATPDARRFNPNELTSRDDGEDGIRVPLRLEWLAGSNGAQPVLFAVLPRGLFARHGVPEPAQQGARPIYIDSLHSQTMQYTVTTHSGIDERSSELETLGDGNASVNISGMSNQAGGPRQVPDSSTPYGPPLAPKVPSASGALDTQGAITKHAQDATQLGQVSGSDGTQTSLAGTAATSSAVSLQSAPATAKTARGRKHRPSDASSSHRKTKRSVVRVNRPDPKERVEAAM